MGRGVGAIGPGSLSQGALSGPCIIFFDEIDALCPVRGSGSSDSGVGDRIVSQFLTEMDGIEELKGVVVLGATNRLDMVDPALSGTF